MNAQSKVIESRELAALRQYAAACLLDKGHLQMPPLPDGNLGEAAFLIELNQAVRDAIAAVWRDESSSIEESKARAEWLLENLYTGLSGALYLRREPVTEAALLQQAAWEIADQLLAALHLDMHLAQPSERLRRKAFLAWVQRRLVQQRTKADPAVKVIVNQAIQHLVLDALDAPRMPEQDNRLTRFVLGQWFLDVDECYSGELSLPAEVSEQLGFHHYSIIEINGLRFRDEEVIQAVATAEQAGKGTIVEAFTQQVFTVVPADTETPDAGFVWRDEASNIVGGVDVLWRLVSSDQAERERILRTQANWFDRRKEDLEQRVQALAENTNFADRIRQAEQWRRESLEFFYCNLESNWGQKAYDWDDLLPSSVEGLLRNYRLNALLDAGAPFNEAWQQAASMLLREEPLAVALERLTCVPIKLPDAVTEALRSLPAQARYDLLQTCRVRWGSPVNQLHLLDLALRCADDGEEMLALAREVVSELFDDRRGNEQFELFGELLSFVERAFSRRPEIASWQVGYKLALTWAHTSRVFNICSRRKRFPDFSGTERHDLAMFFAPDFERRNDILYPLALRRRTFLTHGLANLLSDIELQRLNDAGVIAQIENAFFTEINGVRLPSFELYADPMLAANSTGSFLGANRATAVRNVIEPEAAQLLDTQQLEAWISETLEDLKRDSQQNYSWMKLLMVVGDLPLYPSLREKWESLLRELDLLALYQNSQPVARLALQFLAKQLVYLQDDLLRIRMEDQLIGIAGLAAQTQASPLLSSADVEKPNAAVLASLLAHCFMSLSVNTREAEYCHGGKSLPWQRLIEVWPDAFIDRQFGLFHLSQALPVREGWKVWPVLLAIRAHRQFSPAS